MRKKAIVLSLLIVAALAAYDRLRFGSFRPEVHEVTTPQESLPRIWSSFISVMPSGATMSQR